MITPAALASRYRLVEPYFEPLRMVVRETLAAYCDDRAYAVVSRIKTLDSLAEKVETGRYPGWSHIEDLVAFTVVIPTLAEEEDVIAFLSAAFEPVNIKRRGSARKQPDVFRFDCTRFVGKIRSVVSSSSQREIERISFEVQVRSAFEHAWSVTTHALAYKSTEVDWKQLRLAAQLKAAVEQLDVVVLAFQEASSRVQVSPWPEVQARQDLKKFYLSALEAGRLPKELGPKDWTRFADNVYRLGAQFSKRPRPDEVAQTVIQAVEAELLHLGPDHIPVSLSLWQLTLGSLCKAGALGRPPNQYWPIITPELELLYPVVKGFDARFDFS